MNYKPFCCPGASAAARHQPKSSSVDIISTNGTMMLSAALPLRLRLLAAATLSLTLLASCASVARAEPQAPRLTDFTGDPAAEPSTKAARAIASGSASLRAGLEPPRPSTAADDGAVVHLPDNRGSVRYDIFARQIAKYYCMHTRRWPS